MATGIIRKILKRVKRKLYNNRCEGVIDRMSYIYDPEGVLNNEQFVYLTLGTLVYFGPVTNTGNNRPIGIIIDVAYSKYVAGECMFTVFSRGDLIETKFVYPVAEEIK